MTELNGEEVDDEGDETDGGGDNAFLTDLLGNRNALIFNEDPTAAALSYSSIRFAISSSDVIDTSASKSSVGN